MTNLEKTQLHWLRDMVHRIQIDLLCIEDLVENHYLCEIYMITQDAINVISEMEAENA